MSQHEHFVNGQWVIGAGQEFSSYNPLNEEEIWHGHEALPAEVNVAVESAKNALSEWSHLDITERKKYLEQFMREWGANKENIAELISTEVGKPLWESKTEVNSVINKLSVSIDSQHQRSGQQSIDMPAGNAQLNHRPIGVCAVLGPYNFPAHIPNGQIIPALLAGNTVVFKPSEQAPKVAETYIRLMEQAGLPPGVINLIQGKHKPVEDLIHHQDVDAIFFTGSYETGKYIHHQLAGQPERLLVLEMGGNNPLIWDKTENIDAACHQVIQSSFLTSGQRCTSARRLILIQNDQTEQYIDRLTEISSKIIVDGFNAKPEPFMGPMISRSAAEKVLMAQAQLQIQGGISKLQSKPTSPGSALLSPGIIDITNIKNQTDEEVFGPLLKIIVVNDIQEAISIANQTAYGLSSGVLSDNQETFELVQKHIRAGICNWNRPTTGAAPSMPFGGVGKSGNHHPAGFYSTDFCNYPLTSICSETLTLPSKLNPGLIL